MIIQRCRKSLKESFHGCLVLPPKIRNTNFGGKDIITIDGEYSGTWEIDEDRVFNFTADGETSTTLTNVLVGLLCRDINKWYLKQTYTPPHDAERLAKVGRGLMVRKT